MGPPGARGWMSSNKLETSEARQILITKVEAGTPAERSLQPADSGIMFADGIRLSGLEILARHHIAEGVPLCIALIDPERWGMDNRINRCLSILRQYGGAARSTIPQLRAMQEDLTTRRWKPEALEALDIPGLTRKIEADDSPTRSCAHFSRSLPIGHHIALSPIDTNIDCSRSTTRLAKNEEIPR